MWLWQVQGRHLQVSDMDLLARLLGWQLLRVSIALAGISSQVSEQLSEQTATIEVLDASVRLVLATTGLQHCVGLERYHCNIDARGTVCHELTLRERLIFSFPCANWHMMVDCKRFGCGGRPLAVEAIPRNRGLEWWLAGIESALAGIASAVSGPRAEFNKNFGILLGAGTLWTKGW